MFSSVSVVPLEKKADIKTVPEVLEAISDAETSLNGRGRVIVRPSGTEHKMRVMVEANEGRLAEKWAKEIAAVIKKRMSA